MTGRAGAVLYTRAGCPPCFALARLGERSSRRYRVGLIEMDVDTDPVLTKRYGDRVPILELPGGGLISGRAGAREVDEAFARAASFLRVLEAQSPAARRPRTRSGMAWLRRALGLGGGGTGGGAA